MKKTIFLSLLAALCFTACSSDDETLENSTPRLLTVEVSENPMVDENGAARTRGTEITSATLSEFSMNYQSDYKYDFTKTGGTWSTNTWPVSDTSTQIDFYAYNDGTFYYNSGNPYVSFTMGEKPASQKDLLVDTHKAISYNYASGKVSLAFDHACAAVKFNICKTSGVAGKDVVIKSVTLSGVKNSGNYYYTGSWESLAGSATYTLTDSEITLTTTSEPLPCGYLFLIPQSKSGVTLTVKYTVDGGSEKTYENTWSTGTWATGIEYTINIKMGTKII